MALYVEKNHYNKALLFANKTIASSLKNKNHQKYYDTSIAKSAIYFKLHENDKAFKVLFDALFIAEKQKLASYKIEILLKIAWSYSAVLENNDTARKYTSIGRKLAVLNNDVNAQVSFDRLSFKIHSATNSDSAFYYLKALEKNIKKIKTNKLFCELQNNYFVYYTLVSKPYLAKKHLDSSYFYAKKLTKKELATAYGNLGYHYLTVEKNYKKGEQHYLKQLQLYPNDTTSNAVTDSYLNLSYAYEQLEDYKNANIYLNKYINGTEARYNQELNNNIKDIETKYSIEKVENQYKAKQQLLEDKQSKKTKIFFIFIAVLVLFIILFYFFYQNTKLKQKNKLQDIESHIQQNIINATIDGQENERKKIASVLHDNISALLSSAGLQLSAFVATHPNPYEEISKTRSILKEAHDKVRGLSHELLPTLLAKFGLFYALQDLCEKNSNSLIKFEYVSKVPHSKRFQEDFEMKIYFIVTELLNNVLKHSKASKAKLFIHVPSNELIIQIEDNGIGFDDKSISSEGFGLTQIRARISSMKGTLQINSKPESGTTITIKLPIQE
ncbi:two-component sensor histidine kinase [Flavobacterium sp. GT3R68]|nr:tetratricopeptide repeat-containing sensor histidine kinase [Flavobacterium sp. GSN2]TRW91180.1 two-component sensor histidine kinase [Flavobacterium sp. GT3R68]